MGCQSSLVFPTIIRMAELVRGGTARMGYCKNPLERISCLLTSSAIRIIECRKRRLQGRLAINPVKSAPEGAPPGHQKRCSIG